jgi:predicted cupin superfamily sugar epimerase
MTSREIVEWLRLEPLPVEGGYYRETWRADDNVEASALPARYGSARPLGTAIYYLLTDDPDSFSALHRLPTDEIYHFYLGDPVQQLLLHADGRHEVVTLGTAIGRGQRLQSVVPRGVWQGARVGPGGSFALLGTTMAPGFAPSDYEGGVRDGLLEAYPAAADLVRALTRD